MKTLVAYFSATGVTKKDAEQIAEITQADLYQIKPKVPYTKEDLDWEDPKSRSSLEMTQKIHPELADHDADIEQYDAIFLGFPIWWYVAPTIIDSFIEAYNFQGKTVIPFATSGGSTIEKAERDLYHRYNYIDWRAGKLLKHGVDKEIRTWLSELDY